MVKNEGTLIMSVEKIRVSCVRRVDALLAAVFDPRTKSIRVREFVSCPRIRNFADAARE
jgi:hypothetical protein